MITVGATVMTLIPVPVFYAIFVLELKIVRWDTREVEVASSQLSGSE